MKGLEEFFEDLPSVDPEGTAENRDRQFVTAYCNTLLCGEYLSEGYFDSLTTFEHKVFQAGDAYLHFMSPINRLKSLLFDVHQKIQPKAGQAQVYFNKRQKYRDFPIPDDSALLAAAISIARADHFLLAQSGVIWDLVRARLEITELLKAELDEPKRNVCLKLKSKCSFLLHKLFSYVSKDEPRTFYVDYKLYEIDPLIEPDDYNREFITQYDTMYSLAYQDDKLPDKLASSSRPNHYSPRNAAILACYSTTRNNTSYRPASPGNAISSLESLTSFDFYANKSVGQFISNCRFSLDLKQEGYTVSKLKRDIEEKQIEQAKYGIHNYHPFEKALDYLIGKHQKKDNLTSDEIELFEKLFHLYKDRYKQCLRVSFYPLQLPLKDCMTDDGILIVSSLARPLSPEWLKDKETLYDDFIRSVKLEHDFEKQKNLVKQSLTKEVLEMQEEYKKKLQEQEDLFREKAAAIAQEQRAENDKRQVLYATVITFLIGSVQAYAQVKDLAEALLSIISLSTLLLGFAYLFLYIQAQNGEATKSKSHILILLFVLSLMLLTFMAFISGQVQFPMPY
ncbi:MAG: hypothetical protein CSA97_03070 [Bacteroidetes bacterium]|nr:MAG: hypothetical protein CSA97_03070 [Bacteroidota bacterium]